MLKKIGALMVTGMTILTVMTSCSSQADTTTGNWLADGEEHWKVFVESGKKTEIGEHELNDENKCIVCDSEILNWDDYVSVYSYDTYSNITRMADYDADGNLLSETINEYEYDADGNITKDKQYIDGVLSGETEYTVIDGESITSLFTAYYENDTKSVSKYDLNGNIIEFTDYNSDGTISLQSYSEYAENSEGEWYEIKYIESYSDGTKIECTYNEYEDILSRISYDADGNQEALETWEYTYGDNGYKATVKSYMDGKIIQELIYKTFHNEDMTINYPETVVDYSEDGGKTVSVYDENDELVSETKYDVEGKVVE